MKVRIRGNSLRIRTTKSEVDAFGQEGYIEERTEFGDKTLVYALQQYDGANLSAIFENDKITMLMPKAQAKEWIDTNTVGYEYNKELSNGSKLYLLVEKDFKCLDETMEDQSDNYDNPLLADRS